MSVLRPTQSSNLSNRTGQSSRGRILQQTVLEAGLDANYEEHGDSFDYSKLFESQRLASNQQRSEKAIPYLQELKKGNLIQPFGCLLALDAKTLKVIAFSENAPEMLTAIGHADDSPNLCIGTNILTLFADPGATALNMVLGLANASSLNPIIVQCKASGEPFYAIVHQTTDCLVVDFEPVNPSEFPTAVAWASQSYKLAATAISKIQSLPGGSLQVLCNTFVQEVFDMMGYERVMAYKFHEDFRGEVIAEMTKPGLEPYLGLHYPATDIPKAARFLFMKNKVCIISDCRMKPVKIIEDEELPFHVSLCGSALRAPHSCQLQYMKNMKSVASLVIAVVVNEDGEVFEVTTEEQQTEKNQRKKLWGLIVCHHGSPRYVPFPLRHACEFIGQFFAVHVSKEIELEKRIQEKSIPCMQQNILQVLQASEKTTLERSRCLDLRMDEFVLQDMVVAAISKVQTACQGKGIIISCDLAEKFLKQRLYRDSIQLQKILSDLLFASVKFCPIGGSVTISSNWTKNSIGANMDLIDIELRIKEQVILVPEEILSHMFQGGHGHQLEQGLTLVVCRNLLSLMN